MQLCQQNCAFDDMVDFAHWRAKCCEAMLAKACFLQFKLCVLQGYSLTSFSSSVHASFSSHPPHADCLWDTVLHSGCYSIRLKQLKGIASPGLCCISPYPVLVFLTCQLTRKAVVTDNLAEKGFFFSSLSSGFFFSVWI